MQQSKCGRPEVPAAHLGMSMEFIPSLPGMRSRRTWVLDLHHVAEHSGVPSKGQVFWPWAQGCRCPCSIPLLSPIPFTRSLPPPSFPSPMTCEVEEVCLRHGTFCRYRSIVDMVKSWHQEKQHYSFPHPRECNPRCPSKCSGSVCSHYTQVSATAPCTPRSPQHPAASQRAAHSAWGHCSTRAASSPSPSSSWDPRPNPGSCLCRIWQQAACLPEGCGQPAAMPSHPWSPLESGCLHGGPRGLQPGGGQLGPPGQWAGRFSF